MKRDIAHRPSMTPEGNMSVPTHYRGIEVPGRLRQYWNKPTGRWWRKGIDAKADSMPFVVEPGQIYADNDPRVGDRILRIESLDGNYAHATILRSSGRNQPVELKDREGEPTRILLRRLYPNARGYRLLDESTR